MYSLINSLYIYFVYSILKYRFKLVWACNFGKPDEVTDMQVRAKRLLHEAVASMQEPTQPIESAPPKKKKKQFLQLPEKKAHPVDAFLNSEPTHNLDILNQYPVLKKLFIKYNSALPSSAPVERLFSVGGLTISPKRSKLTDSNFETLVLLKYNRF